MRTIFSFICLLITMSANAQQQITVKCPECGHNITITISIDGATAVEHENTLTTQQNNQCKAVTSKGTQCTRKAQDGTDYCWQHTGASNTQSTTPKTSKSTKAPSTSSSSGGRCRATTKSGSRCSRSARSNGYCWQHGG